MPVLSETRGRVRVLTLNRPEKRNALNLGLCEAVVAALRAADADAGVAAVVLAGAGLGFSAGADLGERSVLEADAALRARRATASLEMLAAPGLMGKPVVSAIHGATVGAGHTLALCCDASVASDEVRISYPEAKHDIFPSLVMPTLLRHVGPKLCFELLATGRVVGPEEALRVGFVNRVVARDALLDEACALAEGAALYGAASLRRVKAAVNAQGEGVAPSAP